MKLKAKLKSHVTVYLGKAGLRRKIPFNTLDTLWSLPNEMPFLLRRIDDKALLAVLIAEYPNSLELNRKVKNSIPSDSQG